MKTALITLFLVAYTAQGAGETKSPSKAIEVGDAIIFDQSYKGVKGCEKVHAIIRGEAHCKEALKIPKNSLVKVVLFNFDSSDDITGWPGGSRYCKYDARVGCTVTWLPVNEQIFLATWNGNSALHEFTITFKRDFTFQMEFKPKASLWLSKYPEKAFWGDQKGDWTYANETATIKFASDTYGDSRMDIAKDGSVEWMREKSDEFMETFKVE